MRIWYVFCHILPKPWMGEASRRPSTLRFIAPSGTSETFRRETALAQLVALRAALSSVTGSSVHGVLLAHDAPAAESAASSESWMWIASSRRVSSKIWR